MSFLAIAWAEAAPVADVYERAISTQMAHRARSDGTGAYPSIRSMAEYALCDEKTIERRLAAMLRRKVIKLGDQRLARSIPKRYRPKVYDLMIPFDWYSASQVDEVNRDRAERGLPPLTAQMRPPLAEPARTGRKPRADKGVSRPPKAEESDSSQPLTPDLFESQGGLTVPPAEPAAQPAPGGTNSPDEGGLIVPAGGTVRPPKQSSTKLDLETVQGGPPPSNPPDPAADAAGTKPPANAAQVVSTEGESVGDPLRVRARDKAGTQACAAIDDNPLISADDLAKVISEQFPRLTHIQAYGRAATLVAFEAKARALTEAPARARGRCTTPARRPVSGPDRSTGGRTGVPEPNTPDQPIRDVSAAH
jgi:hypothetical protein